jgi:hypothetical protein
MIWLQLHRHCEYQGFEYLHVDPATQVVGPLYPWPPHCPHFGTVPPLTEEEALPPLPPAVELSLVLPAAVVVPGAADVASPPELPLFHVATTAGPVGCSEILSSARTHPVLAVIAAGQVTCL